MINTILFISTIVLILILFALLVVVFMEFRAKRSYDHYVMQSGADAKGYNADISGEKSARTIPEPIVSEDRAKESRQELEIEPEKKSDEEEFGSESIFRQLPIEKEEKSTESKAADEIRNRDYGDFTHNRLVESMGLTPKEADEFVLELISQLEAAIAELDEKIEQRDFEEIEHITHGLKGAALNIGSGGIADILVDYNNRMKEESDIEAALAYQELLKNAVSDLKIEYSQVA